MFGFKTMVVVLAFVYSVLFFSLMFFVFLGSLSPFSLSSFLISDFNVRHFRFSFLLFSFLCIFLHTYFRLIYGWGLLLALLVGKGQHRGFSVPSSSH